MKIKIEKAWMNVKCNECGELIYPNEVYRARPEKGKLTPLAEWNFCKRCFKKIFSEETIKKAK